MITSPCFSLVQIFLNLCFSSVKSRTSVKSVKLMKFVCCQVTWVQIYIYYGYVLITVKMSHPTGDSTICLINHCAKLIKLIQPDYFMSSIKNSVFGNKQYYLINSCKLFAKQKRCWNWIRFLNNNMYSTLVPLMCHIYVNGIFKCKDGHNFSLADEISSYSSCKITFANFNYLNESVKLICF